MGLGRLLGKIGRGAAAVRLSMHGYTPEVLEREREMLEQFREERRAEAERKRRAEERAELAAERAQRAEEDARAQRERSNAVSTATALAASERGDSPEFLATLSPEVADLYGIKPDQVDPVLGIARRIVQARKDEERAKREQAATEKAATAAAAEDTFQRHARFTDQLIRGRRPKPNPRFAKDPDYQDAWRAVAATRDPDDPETDPLAFLSEVDRIYPQVKARRKAREGQAPGAAEGNPFADLLGRFMGGGGAPTSPGQPVGRWVRER